MKDYLREIWRGTWNPSAEDIVCDETACKKTALEKKIEEIQSKLSMNMNQEQLQLLVQYDKNVKALMDITREDGFVKGCSFIGKLLVATLTEPEK